MKKPYALTLVAAVFCVMATSAQQAAWQQHASYKMEVNMDVKKHQLRGKQHLQYTNNSPDTLHKVYYHLYFNAFQPGSMMDVRSRTIVDPDRRVGERISKLLPHEIGYQKINSLKLDGTPVKFEIVETVLKVLPNVPIAPGATVVFEMDFEAQVPVQIRRNGRNNVEGIDYSMAQWYPKIAEYDKDGWHPDFYVGREFYGVWADFDVKITIDKSYIVAGTGYLQNPQEIGYGYQEGPQPNHKKKKTLTWHFLAPQVHDFMWAADPDYQHYKLQVPDGPMLHFFYTPTANQESWEKLPEHAVKFFKLMESLVGKYPYDQYSVIQGGDGGMEYPMATLVRGNGDFEGFFGLFVHEAVHSWFYGLLAFHEGKYPWMDEGFTSFIENEVVAAILRKDKDNVHGGNYANYFFLVDKQKEEPLTTHADHYNENRTYSINSYSKGGIFLQQLRYIVGEEVFWTGMQLFYEQFKYRHPDPHDFIRVFEKLSDMELDWYMDYWVATTKHIDYAVDGVKQNGNKAAITLSRIGAMPMPLDVYVKFKNGEVRGYTIPLAMMFGAKADENLQAVNPWRWTHPQYILDIEGPSEVELVVIDNFGFMADTNRKNNSWPIK